MVRMFNAVLLSIFLLFPSFVFAAFGQSWNTPPPSTFDKDTQIEVSCTNYQADVEGAAESLLPSDFTVSVNGAPPVCGTTFNLYNALVEAGQNIIDGAKFYLCLSGGSPNITVQECIDQNDSSLVNTIFRTSGGGGGGIPYFIPEVKLISPAEEGTIGDMVEIKYEASDLNDSVTNTKDINGLGPNPVSIFYFETLDPEKKILIAKDLPAIGTYKWSTKDLPENFYKILVKAKDISGQSSEAFSPTLFIDNVSPVFVVKTEPAVSQGEDVKIIVEASEELAESPEVIIAQKSSGITVSIKIDPLSVSGSARVERMIFGGVYNVIKGYDGPAKILVSGKDKAGNIGNRIVSGGQFFVGVEPPPKPIIISPLDKEVVASENITIAGNVREDTEVLLTVNGADKYKVKPDGDGNFVFKNIKISPEFNRGLNYLNLTARDETGNESETESISVKLNIVPELKIVTPAKNIGIVGVYAIKIEASDGNRDKLTFTYEISSDKGENWTVLSKATPERQFSWNTIDFADGEYILRVTADDGFSKTQITSDSFLVENGLPQISFVDGGRSVSNKTNPTISGAVAGPERRGKRSEIASLEYSVNNGKDWINVSASDGALDSFEEKFRIQLSGLNESQYTILFRAKDKRGFLGRAQNILIVDFGPPPKTKILNPTPASVISNEDDEEKDMAGVQVTVSGDSEPNSIVNVSVDDKVFSGKTGTDGKFEVKVTLRQHGQNNLTVFAFDIAGNKSDETKFSLVYNNPPTIRFINPRPNRGLNHKSLVKWALVDNDLDPIKDVILSYRKNGQPFEVLLKNPTENVYELDVTNFLESGDYKLKLEAKDQVSSSVEIMNFFVDNTSPEISVEPLSETVFRKKFVLKARGQAFDNFSGIEFVEFSVDSEHWFKALITEGFLKKTAAFRIKQEFELEDGTYNVSFRAADVAGNLSEIKSQQITVDKSSPRIGSYTLSKGDIVIFPEGDIFKILRSTKIKLTISLEQDTKEATLSLNDKKMNLEKNKSTGLWERDLDFVEAGNLEMKISAEDQVGNLTENKEIGLVTVINSGLTKNIDGKFIDDVKITIFVLDEENKSFVRWQAESYNLENPIFSNKSGEYELLLPSGRYRLLIQKPGFERIRTSEFEIPETRFINFDFQLNRRGGIKGFLENLMDIISL